MITDELLSNTESSLVADEIIEFRGAVMPLWWKKVPQYSSMQTAVFGYPSKGDETKISWLLRIARRLLLDKCCNCFVGPINHTTWNSYRLVTVNHKIGGNDFFAGEPPQIDAFCNALRKENFSPIFTYRSTIENKLRCFESSRAELFKKFAKQQIVVTALSDFDRERGLNDIFKVTSQSFERAPLYCPITREQFYVQICNKMGRVPLEYSFLAHSRGRPVGFVVAYPDNKSDSGRTRLIVKTLAILPERSLAGLGRHLLDYCYSKALREGIPMAVHALMRNGAISVNFASDSSKILREYALWGQLLHR